MKFIDLANSLNLIVTPDFTGVPNLEKLVLSNCTKLCELHSSIGILKKLILLDLRRCRKLSCLPRKFEMESLVTLELSGCFDIEKIPEFVGNMGCLQELKLDGTGIKELPSSVEGLIGLTSLSLAYCDDLVCLPSAICSLKSLESLDLSWCLKIDKLPKNLGNVKGLKVLKLSGTAIEELPSSIEHLTSLTLLTFNKCKNLMCLPNSIFSLKLGNSLDLAGCSKFDNLPENLGNVEGLEKLDLSGTAIKELPSSIEHLTSLTLLSLKNCKNLVCLPSTICCLKLLNSLDLSGCSKFDSLPENLGNVEGLEFLDLSGTSIKEVPSSIVLLKNLKELLVHGLKETLFSFNSMPRSHIVGGLLLPSLSGLHSLIYLDLCDCDLSSILNDIGNLSSLARLNLCGNNFVSLPKSISQLSNLQTLHMEGCKMLQSLENVPSTIEFIIANNCTSLERLPELQNHPFRSCPSRLLFTYLNCFKLVDNIQSGRNMLQVSLSLGLSISLTNIMLCIFKGQSGRLPNMLEIIIPGGEIPKGFSPARFILKSPLEVSFKC